MPFNRFEAPEAAVESAVSSVATKMTMAGGAGGVIGFLSSSTGIAITGLLFAALGFVVNWWFRRKDDQRHQMEFELRKQLALAEEDRNKELHRAQMASLEKHN